MVGKRLRNFGVLSLSGAAMALGIAWLGRAAGESPVCAQGGAGGPAYQTSCAVWHGQGLVAGSRP